MVTLTRTNLTKNCNEVTSSPSRVFHPRSPLLVAIGMLKTIQMVICYHYLALEAHLYSLLKVDQQLLRFVA